MNLDAKVMVAGARGLVGGAVLRRLQAEGFRNLLAVTRNELDLAREQDVAKWFERERPEYVFLCGAKVGGILANNSYPADFIRENLAIQLGVIHHAWRTGVKKLLFLGSSCIYPKLAPQPMKEEHLLTGPLEPTNSAYALAKIAGIEMCQAYRRQHGFNAISLMPTNLYGPGDNFDLQNSHVLPALLRKFHEAKVAGSPEVVVWGTGSPRREFLYVDDLADACLYLMRHYDEPEIVNVGVGEDLSIADLARTVGDVVGYTGAIEFDTSKPDGTPRKLLDVSKLAGLGWRARTGLREGLEQTYAWWLAHEGVSPGS